MQIPTKIAIGVVTAAVIGTAACFKKVRKFVSSPFKKKAVAPTEAEVVPEVPVATESGSHQTMAEATA